jgi:hypothetical protein
LDISRISAAAISIVKPQLPILENKIKMAEKMAAVPTSGIKRRIPIRHRHQKSISETVKMMISFFYFSLNLSFSKLFIFYKFTSGSTENLKGHHHLLKNHEV